MFVVGIGFVIFVVVECEFVFINYGNGLCVVGLGIVFNFGDCNLVFGS